MELTIQRDDGAPVYQQIADHFRQAVRAGELAAGARLPTIRALASDLGVNRDTVGLAYEALAAEGLVESRVGRGTFVRRPGHAGPPAPARAVYSPLVERLLEHARRRPAYANGEGCVPLHALVPDPALFPVEAFRRAMSRALAGGGAELLGYGPSTGHAGLREVIAAHLATHGLRVGADEVVLCQGATQGIALALRLFAEAGDGVALEEPTYHNVLSSLAGLGLRPHAVPMAGAGVDLAALERTLARPEVKAFYTIPTFHNPMGVSSDLAHRRDVLAIAARHGKPVIEDAFELDLRFAGRPVPSLAALDADGLVVQLCSFSKSLFPGVRVGAVIARGRAVEGLLALKHASDLGGALPLQAALADFLRSGAYEKHLAKLRRRLRARRDVLIEALAAELPGGSRWTEPEGGYQLWVSLPGAIDTRELLADGERAGVLFAPGDQFHHDGRPSNALRLSISLADEAGLRLGAERLGAIARARLREARPAQRDDALQL